MASEISSTIWGTLMMKQVINTKENKIPIDLESKWGELSGRESNNSFLLLLLDNNCLNSSLFLARMLAFKVGIRGASDNFSPVEAFTVCPSSSSNSGPGICSFCFSPNMDAVATDCAPPKEGRFNGLKHYPSTYLRWKNLRKCRIVPKKPEGRPFSLPSTFASIKKFWSTARLEPKSFCFSGLKNPD